MKLSQRSWGNMNPESFASDVSATETPNCMLDADRSKLYIATSDIMSTLCPIVKTRVCSTPSKLVRSSLSSNMSIQPAVVAKSKSVGHISPTQLNFSIPQCSPSLSGFPRFPNPLKVEENCAQSLTQTQMVQPRMNPVSRRSRHFVPNERKDEYYWQKRRKNNEAARKSREKRRTIDSVLEEKVLILSHENKILKSELYALKIKYGEIDTSDTETLSTEYDKTSFSVMSNLHNGHASQFDDSLQLGNDLFNKFKSGHERVGVTRQLPQVGVILDKDAGNCPTDAASSAKLVLSSLATGTLVLSPVDLSDKDKATGDLNAQASRNDMSGLLNLRAVDVKKQEDELAGNEMKTLEAANTLATLLHCNGNDVGEVGDCADLYDTDVNARYTDKSGTEHSNSGLTASKSQSEGKSLRLPHKLRFKTIKFD